MNIPFVGGIFDGRVQDFDFLPWLGYDVAVAEPEPVRALGLDDGFPMDEYGVLGPLFPTEHYELKVYAENGNERFELHYVGRNGQVKERE